MKNYFKIFFLLNFLFFFISQNSFSQETKFQFRGVPQDSKPKEAILKINPDLLISINDARKLSNELENTNIFLKKINEKYKPMQEYTLRGAASNIYSKYVQSVFLIYNQNSKMIGAGSLIDSEGFILTNLHVVERAQFVQVILKPEGKQTLENSPRYQAEVLYLNKKNDLALIKAKGLPKNVSIIQLGSLRDVKIGEEVHAIGHPLSLYWSYTKGVVSQIRDNYKWTYEKKENFEATVIQTQTPISEGNSGGPLFNNDGRLVGINTLGAGKGQNLNFSVAVDEARELLNNRTKYTNKSTYAPEKKSNNPILQKFPDAKEASSKKDGIIDTWYLKNKETGKYDRALVDLKRRGIIDGMLVDTKGNGKWTAIYLDEERAGYWTSVVTFDQNGKPDQVGYLNRNGKVERWEKLS